MKRDSSQYNYPRSTFFFSLKHAPHSKRPPVYPWKCMAQATETKIWLFGSYSKGFSSHNLMVPSSYQFFHAFLLPNINHNLSRIYLFIKDCQWNTPFLLVSPICSMYSSLSCTYSFKMVATTHLRTMLVYSFIQVLIP